MMKHKYTGITPHKRFALLVFALAAIFIATNAMALENSGKLRKLNVSKEGNSLYVKLTGTARFRYRVKTENNPPRLTVQLYNTESELGYNTLAINQGYVKDVRIQETVVGGQKATFILLHLNQSVSVDYGLSGDGRTLYLSTPLYAGADDSLKTSPYSAEAATPPPSSSGSPSKSMSPGLPGNMPPEIVVPGGDTPVIPAPASEMVPYKSSSGSAQAGSSTDFSQSRGVDNSPYIVGPVILQDADVSKAVQLLSEAAGGASIIVESKVLEESSKGMQTAGAGGQTTGGITMTLSHVTLEDALDIITSANGWVWKKLANSYVIVSRDTATEGLDSISAAKAFDITSDKIQVTIYKPKYVDACSLVIYTTSAVPDSVCDKSLNMLVLRGRYEDIIKAKSILGSVDVARSKNEIDSAELRMRQQNEMMGQTLVTRVVRLKYIRSSDLLSQLKTLMDNPYFGNLTILPVNMTTNKDNDFSKNEKSMNTLTVDDGSNTLVFVGREEIFNRVLKVVQQLDVKFSATVVRTIQLQYAFAKDLKTDLSKTILENIGRTSSDGSSSNVDSNVMYNEMTNSVTFIGTEDNFERFKTIIESYDTEEKAVITEHFVFKNVLVSDILKTGMLTPILNSPSYGYAEMWLAGQQSSTGNTDDTISSKTRLSAHEPNNSFVITAQRRYLDRIKEFMRSLDSEQDKVKTKFIKLKYVNALRVVSVATRMLKLYEGSEVPEQMSTTILGGFYDCGGQTQLERDEGGYRFTVSCEMPPSTAFFTSMSSDDDPNKRYHWMALYQEASQNILIVRATQKDIDRLMEIVQMMDVPHPQVKIDIQVVQISTDDYKTFSNTFLYNDGKYQFDNASTGDSSSWLTYDSSSDAAARVLQSLNYLVDNNRANILANPSLVTRESVLSYFVFNDVYRYTPPATVVVPGLSATSTMNTSTTVPSVTTGPSVFLLTHIDTENNTVLLHIWPTYSTLNGFNSDGLPQTGSQSMEQELVIKSGETLIAAGFINSQEIDSIQRVPILSNLPIVGNLFKNKYRQKNEKEVIFLITPTILPTPTG